MAGTQPDQVTEMTGQSKGMWRRLSGEPLVHFFVVGALVFCVSNLNEEPARVNEQSIEISANEIRQMAIAGSRRGARCPPGANAKADRTTGRGGGSVSQKG